MSLLIYCTFCAATVAFVLTARRFLPGDSRLPLDVYCVAYGATFFVGASLIGLPQTRDWWLLYSVAIGLDAVNAPSSFGTTYWLLVFSPFFVPAVGALCLHGVLQHRSTALLSAPPPPVGPASAWIVLGTMLAWCLLELYRSGQFGQTLLTSTLTYEEGLAIRYALFASVGDLFFRCAYVGIPLVGVYALARYITNGEPKWAAVAGAAMTGALFLYLSTFQKSFVLVLAMMVTIVLIKTGKIRYRAMVVVVPLLICVLAGLNFLLAGRNVVGALASLADVVFRMPSSLPFYEGLFPGVRPFLGLDWGLAPLGLGPSEPANWVVMNYMFPDVTWVQGFAPAPAHVQAYAEGGIWWSVVMLLAVGVFVGATGRLLSGSSSPLSVTALTAGCVAIYYFTQTGFWSAVQDSYGLLWSLATLALLIGVERVIHRACANFEYRSLRG